MYRVQISVITVCYNAENEIEKTIRSILAQDYADYEYIIKDGLSSDGTLEIANSFSNEFEKKNVPYKIYSGKDSGIYDAMNESLSYASGDWVIYINAGDELYDLSVLSRISPYLSNDIKVLYGDVMLKENGYTKIFKAQDMNGFRMTNPICHQGAFTRLDIVRKYRFNLDYKIAADFDMFLRIYTDYPDGFKYVEMIVSNYLMGGLSGRRVFLREKEFDLSRKANKTDRVFIPIFQIIKICFVEYLRIVLINVLGKRFYSIRRGWRII